ncbi:tRNA (adenosine(37)-N6)-dimethylallyltransferase MiaA [Alkalicoccus urumqiensis]|uniref:tRNA dimethylallyltransferase n=1 Tax=Alkalicoccus urumqiensis TaxID=1548213 RepID=A0A2P6MFV3_ALKUR|nr:tRNA (adenosine(37)-N6)-dimethylallyltransferase MiaA [Alkalicoccus urumqiensis]PRO65158.1 tRNA (adenosine(37)-N6)-dimethylallyltransferase MiaA [Alkalicoccus urumqiensis]
MKPKILVIAGPTAVGKSAFALEAAEALNGEIINGDSMQVYRGMNIGTAKPSGEELSRVRHHLIDIKSPDENYTAAQFKEDAENAVRDIAGRGKLPIIVGGTGMYLQSFLYNYSFQSSGENKALRAELEQIAESEGNAPLYERLKQKDPVRAQNIHPNNVHRVIRALEIVEENHDFSTAEEEESSSPYDFTLGVLTMERENLYDLINKRVDLMIEQGLLEEVQKLLDEGFRDCRAMKAIGYKEIIPYLDGGMELEEAAALLKRNSRRFAKRQWTWFRNKMQADWFDVTGEREVKHKEILRYLHKNKHFHLTQGGT